MENNLFEYNPETNEIEYLDEGGEANVSDDPFDPEGSLLQPETMDPEEVPESQIALVDPDLTDSGIMLLSEDDLTALAVNAPAAGSLNSSTIDYFDRLVNGLSSDYCYVAYRYSVDDAYAGTIVYGKDYDLNDNTIVFGDGAVQIDVERHSGAGISTYISYDASDASNSVISVYQSGNVLYYTNAFDGFPVLGSGSRSLEVAPLLVAGLVAAFCSAVLNKLLNRRRKHD